MVFYSGLPREKVLEIYRFVINKRRVLKIGQRKLFKMVSEKYGLGIKERTIAGWIFKKVMPYDNEKTWFRSKLRPKKEDLYEFYINQRQSAESLGRLYNVSTVTVIGWLKAYEISTRNHKESMNTPLIKEELMQKKLKRPTKDYASLSPEKAYILGVLCGDACLTKKIVRLEIKKDEEFVAEFVDSFEKVYGLKYKYIYYKPKNSFVAQISSILIAKDLARYANFKTREWKVPKEISESNDSKLIGAFLRGFYDSEGSATRSAIISCSVNRVGLEQVGRLLENLDIKNKMVERYNGKFYLLYIFRKERMKRYIEKVGFTIKRKKEVIENILNTGFFSKKSVA